MPPKRNGYSRPAARHLTNPKKELADSLPLCHPNDEYLKDFNPITTSKSSRSELLAFIAFILTLFQT